MAASLATANVHQKGTYYARQLRAWAKAFITDRDDLPFDQYGRSKISKLDNEELMNELHLHLQSVGRYVKAGDLVTYLSDKEAQSRFGLKSTISLATAKKWMHTLGYHWRTDHRGQYVDGHERGDVVNYCQNIFIPEMMALQAQMRRWMSDGLTSEINLEPHECPVEVWLQDEVTFYANDRRHSGWYHLNAGSDPRPKGEGISIMISDFISADRGWCRSRDGKESARVVFRAGKSRDGWYTSEDMLKQVTKVMDILENNYPESDHVLVESGNGGVETTLLGEDGKPVHGRDGKVLKTKVPMQDGRFADGRPQPLYFPPGHEHAGKFKGMAEILWERGYNVSKLKAQCTKFRCPEGATQCCCRRILFNEPDFVGVPSRLEEHCLARHFKLIILPKFHCELNFIEQCWGYAKRLYRLYPPTTKDEEMETPLVVVLDLVKWELPFLP
ncbi:hypothetical protein DEU56DRAFT_870337 [Suillus clintonianus]|uniref:uncharacterized protein n=1 Tax=Suillus clintonianus TaxID=1904413 RepID=UPI001B869AFF|nr:uncharacterized protein DEU56DRAFT_870337 [Suillus clintonianus]KAG2144548.1 hypothetical protein DEU56DRAFT_870337 [Suillus clintonianus]